ncbi:MAG: hypothetical protein JNG84_08080 [Archangium sp.]|nr:hypothetical protein [Archangium sp.]
MSSSRHDTPVDPQPAVEVPAAYGSAMRRMLISASVSSAYEAWHEARDGAAQALRACDDELARLDAQGALVVGAIRRVTEPQSIGTAAGDALATFRGDAAAQLNTARDAVVAKRNALELAAQKTSASLLAELRERVERLATIVKPTLRLMVRVLAGDRRMLHAERLGEDEAIAFLFATSGRVPTRYDALFDDSTDDASAAPPSLYAEEGVSPAQLRPNPRDLAALLSARLTVWPVKGMVPWAIEGAGPMWRWLQRGPVMEAEVEDGAGFRGVLSVAEAEVATAHFIQLKLAGRIELELVDR